MTKGEKEIILTETRTATYEYRSLLRYDCQNKKIGIVRELKPDTKLHRKTRCETLKMHMGNYNKINKKLMPDTKLYYKTRCETLQNLCKELKIDFEARMIESVKEIEERWSNR